MGSLVLFLVLEENFQCLAIEDDVSCGLVVCGHYYVEVLLCFFYIQFVENFYHERILNLSNTFSASIE